MLCLQLGSLSGGGGRISRCEGSWDVGMCPWGVSGFWPQRVQMATLRVHLIEDLVSDWGCKRGTNKRGEMQSKRVGHFQVLLILQRPPELEETNLFLMAPVFVGFLLFFFFSLWNSPFNLYYLSIIYPVADPQLNSGLHLNHWTSFLVFAFSLPQTSSVQCSHSSNSVSDVGRDHEQLVFAQAQDFVQPNYISLCVSVFQLGGCLFTPCIETTVYFTLFSLVLVQNRQQDPRLSPWGSELLRGSSRISSPRQKQETSQVPPLCFSSVSQKPWQTLDYIATGRWDYSAFRRSCCSSPFVHSLLGNFMRQWVWRWGPRDVAARNGIWSGTCFSFLVFRSTLMLCGYPHGGWVGVFALLLLQRTWGYGAKLPVCPSNPWESWEETMLLSLCSQDFAPH